MRGPKPMCPSAPLLCVVHPVSEAAVRFVTFLRKSPHSTLRVRGAGPSRAAVRALQSWRTLSTPEDSALAILPPKTGFCMRRLERDSCPSLLILTLLFRFCLLDLILTVRFSPSQILSPGCGFCSSDSHIIRYGKGSWCEAEAEIESPFA